MKFPNINILFYFILFSGCTGPYIDGIYHGQSRSVYTEEPYVGNVDITVEKGYIIRVDYKITDTSVNELFDNMYEKHFPGNDLYIEQCRNDWKGVITYPGELLKMQNIEKVNAISGATWSYNIFKESCNEALKDAIIREIPKN